MAKRSADFPATQVETHFNGRELRCYAERAGCVMEMCAATTKRHPDAEAFVCKVQRLTWKEFYERVLTLAAGLRAHGVKAGDRVGLFADNCIEYPLAVMAILALRAVVVPVNSREQGPGLRYMLDQSGACGLLYQSDLREKVNDAKALSGLTLFVEIGGQEEAEAGAGAIPLSTLEKFGHLPEVEKAGEEDVAVILYTSGTTGRPKGAMLTHLNIVHAALTYCYHFGLNHSDRISVLVPLSHVTGLVGLMMTSVQCGAALIIEEGFKAQKFLQMVEREKITTTIMVPAMYNLCLLQEDLERYNLSSWKNGIYGGAPMPGATIDKLSQQLPNMTLCNAYGATEASGPVTLSDLGRARETANTVGRAITCADIMIVDDNAQAIAVGEVGEIWIRGPMIIKGYWHNQEATRDNIQNGYWKSGDIGCFDGDGYVRVLDRKKDMLNRGGYKIYCAEVENILYQHPDIVEASIIGRPCKVLGERVHAFVVLEKSKTVGSAELQKLCGENLSDYKIPESFTFLSAPLPRNANGKIIKSQLREML